MSRREHGGGKPVSSDEALRQEAAVYLSPTAEHQLANIMERREAVEAALQRMDVEIYDLESEYLKHCVSFGGSLFDGFGLERRSNAHRNPVGVLTPLHAAAHAGSTASTSGSFDPATVSGGLPGSPLLSTTATGEQLRTYQFLTNSFQGSSSSGDGSDGHHAGGTTPAVFQVGSKGASSPAFHYRIHFFSPSERVFSACSVGALSRVEIAKSTVEKTTNSSSTSSGGGGKGTVARSTYGTGRSQGGGKRGRHGGGGGSGAITAAFAREPDAPPSRRRQREDNDGGSNGENSTANNGESSQRRRRHTE